MSSARRPSQLPHRILLVDDNQHGNIARKSLLEEHGFSVETALSGEEAWDLFTASSGEERFEVVVTDLRMKNMNGVELIQLIRASEFPAFTILLSGFAACLGLDEGTTGADAVLAKTNKEGEQLTRCVQQLLARKTLRKPAASQKKLRSSVARSG